MNVCTRDSFSFFLSCVTVQNQKATNYQHTYSFCLPIFSCLFFASNLFLLLYSVLVVSFSFLPGFSLTHYKFLLKKKANKKNSASSFICSRFLSGVLSTFVIFFVRHPSQQLRKTLLSDVKRQAEMIRFLLLYVKSSLIE